MAVSQEEQCNRAIVNSERQTGQRVGAGYMINLQMLSVFQLTTTISNWLSFTGNIRLSRKYHP
jgi:hypothetical protein